MKGVTISLPYSWGIFINWHGTFAPLEMWGYRYNANSGEPIRTILILWSEISWFKKIERPIYPGMTVYNETHPDYPNSPRDWDKHKMCKRRSGAEALGLSWKHHPVGHHRHEHDIVAYFSKTKESES